MKKKKMMTTLLAMSAILLLAACGNKESKKDAQKTVGVLQIVQHPSLDAAYEGFKEGLKEGGYTEGKNVKFDYQNAQNNQDNLKSSCSNWWKKYSRWYDTWL